MIDGGQGDDVLEGRAGFDALYGGIGAELLRRGFDAAALDGGAGEDTVAYDVAPGPVTIDLGLAGVFQDMGGAGTQELTSVENVTGSPFADRLTGSAGANAIAGGAGADTIAGGEGADRLAGGAGVDAIDSRDTSPDSISCGAGPDSLATDALDSLAPDCAPPAPPGGGGLPGGDAPGGGTPGGGTPAAPVLVLSVPRQSLRSALAGGLRAVLTCSAACRAVGRLAATRSAARRHHIGARAARRIGRLGPVDLAAGSPRTVRIRIGRSARRALRSARCRQARAARSCRRRGGPRDRDRAPGRAAAPRVDRGGAGRRRGPRRRGSGAARAWAPVGCVTLARCRAAATQPPVRVIAGALRRAAGCRPAGRRHAPDGRPRARGAVLDPRRAGARTRACSTCSPARARSGWRRSRAGRGARRSSRARRPRCAALRANLAALGAEAEVVRADALRWLRAASGGARQYDLVFLDPPYRRAADLGAPLSDSLPAVLAPGALVVAECDRRAPLELTITKTDERRYGDTLIRFHAA